jgi:ERCC4-type nuclease
MATAETFIDTFEPDLWARELSGLVDSQGKPLKHNLKSMGYDGDILIRCEIDGETKTWGIERKTLTDALNSWMNKRLIRQVHDLSEKVDYPILFVIDEPAKRISNSPNNPYRKFASHIPNLESHLNRIAMELCPVLRFPDEPTAIRQVKSLVKRIEAGDFQSVRLHTHRVSEPDEVVDFLMGIPKVGKKRAADLKKHFNSLTDLMGRLEDIEPLVRTEPDRQSIKQFLKQEWKHEP